MPIYAIEAKGAMAEQWKTQGIAHLLYGSQPRAFRDLDDAVLRAKELKRFSRDEEQIDFQVKEVPLEFYHLYWPLG